VIPFLILCAACLLLIAGALWADAVKFDPWTWLYGTTDPRELVDRARERGQS
jgi:hypothetical protein